MITAFFKTNKHKKLEEAKEEEFPSFKSEAPTENPLFIRKKTKLKFKNSQIRKILNTDVIEVTFKRRRWPIVRARSGQKKAFRRMMCTSNFKFVQSIPNFKFKPPKGIMPRTKAWYKKRKLVIVYDIIRKDWRMISLNDYNIVNVYQTDTEEKQRNFLTAYKILFKRFGKAKLVDMFNK